MHRGASAARRHRPARPGQQRVSGLSSLGTADARFQGQSRSLMGCFGRMREPTTAGYGHLTRSLVRNLDSPPARRESAAFTKTQHSRWLRSPVVTLLLPVGSGSEKPLGVGRALLSFNEERWRRRGQSLASRGLQGRAGASHLGAGLRVAPTPWPLALGRHGVAAHPYGFTAGRRISSSTATSSSMTVNAARIPAAVAGVNAKNPLSNPRIEELSDAARRAPIPAAEPRPA